MLFNSPEFIVFIALFFVAWPILRKWKTARWGYLTAASFFFYGWWDWRFVFLILASGFIDFFAAMAMVRWPSKRKLLLVASIVGNVGSLGAFKYLDFFTGNINWIFACFGSDFSLPLLHFPLPVGISFYTFQSMSYTIDVYRGKLTPTRNVLHFFAYLAMFPQLVAGPIVRATYLLPQLEHVVPTTEEKRWEGMRLIAYGFFKKMVVADTIAPVVNNAFAMETPLASCSYWWIVMVMFAFQIYCDFSGYSDIARGLAKWMGYEFPLNFDHPYLSSSIREFWKRWHISLSSWFQDYVYIPLGGSRRGAAAGLRNMWIAMLVSGLWHGASWTFLAWGAMHALYLTIERKTRWPEKLAGIRGGRHIAVLVIFLMVLFAWVFFRAESLDQAGVIILRMFDVGYPGVAAAAEFITWKAVLVTGLMIGRQAVVYSGLHDRKWRDSRWAVAAHTIAVGVLLTACVFFRGPGAAFIYFQF
ncbi:MAG TPA: MBOAT family protein [Candidatus Hydrogenedentes bacterium]|nr:MBOAT family protein [Candidatus Hydrogenedentota bacterium]